MEPLQEGEAQALLHAAERSLFDATVRLEQALAALGRQPGVDAASTLEHAQLWSDLIQVNVAKLGQRVGSVQAA